MPTDHPPIRVLIADDHPFARDGLELLLRAEPYVEVVGSVRAIASYPAL